MSAGPGLAYPFTVDESALRGAASVVLGRRAGCRAEGRTGRAAPLPNGV